MSIRYWSSPAPISSICARAAACFDWPTRPKRRGPTRPTRSPSTMMTTSSSISVNPASPPSWPRSRRGSRDFASRVPGRRRGWCGRGWPSPPATRVVSARTPMRIRSRLALMRAVASPEGSATPSRTTPAAAQRYLVNRKDREHHRDDDEGDEHAHAEDDDRFQEPEHALEIGPHVGLERLGDLEEHVL